MGPGDLHLSVVLSASVSAFQAQMGVARGEVRALGADVATSTGKAKQGFDQLGRSGLLVGAAIATGMGLATRSAIGFESAFANVRRTVGGSERELGDMRDGIRQLAREMPASATEIANVAASAGQLGVQRDSILEFTRTMVQLGAVTTLSADDAATGIARLMNVMQTAPQDVDRVASSLTALGLVGASTETDILEMAQRIASAGHQIGASESDVLALANALSSVGIDAEAGGTAVSRVLIEIQNAVFDGGQALERFAAVAGTSAEKFAEEFRTRPALAFVSFTEGLRRIQDEGGNTNRVLEDLGLTDIRVGNALRSAAGAGDLFRQSLEVGAKAWDDNVALARSYEERTKTTSAQLQILRNNVNDLAIEFGDQLLPGVTMAAHVVTDLTGGVRLLVNTMGPAAPIVASLAAAALLLGGGFLLLAPRIVAAQAAMALLTEEAPLVATGLRAVTAASAGIGIALAAASVAYALFADHQDEARVSTDKMAESFQAFARGETAAAQRLVLEGLAAAGLLEQLNKFGLTKAAVTEIMTTAQDGGEKNVAAIRAWSDALDGAVRSGRLTRSEADELARSVFHQANAYADAAGSASDVVVAQQQLTGSTQGSGDAFDTADEALQKYSGDLDKLYSSTLGISDAQNSYGQDLADFADNVRAAQIEGDRFATSLDSSTEAGIRNQQALGGIVRDALDVADAMVQAGRAPEEVAAVIGGVRLQLVDVLAQLGMTSDEAQRYTDILLSVPTGVNTTVTVDASQAMTEVYAYIALLERAGVMVDKVGAALAVATGQVSMPSSSSAVLRDALGGRGSAATRARESAAKSAGEHAKSAEEAARKAKEARDAAWAITDNAFDAGAVKVEDYLRELDRRIAGEQKYTADWMTQVRRRQQVTDQLAQQLQQAQKAYQALEDNQHEAGVISNARYVEILQQRLSRLRAFSDEWMAVWRQINQIEKDALDAQREAAQDAADKALKARDEAFDKLNKALDDEADIRKRMQQLEADHRARMAEIERQFAQDQQGVLAQRRDELLAWANVTEQVEIRWGNSVSALTGNIRSQIDTFTEWTDALADARNRGVSDQVISLLGLDEGPQALGQLRMFSSATQAEIDQLNQAVALRAQQVSDRIQAEQASSVSKVGQMLAQLAEKHAAEVEAQTEQFLADQRALNDELAQVGRDGGRSFGEAIADGLNSSIPAIREAARAAQQALQQAADAQARLNQTPQTTTNGQVLVTGDTLVRGPDGIVRPERDIANFFGIKPGPDGRYSVPVGSIPTYALGTNSVPSDGVAYLHRGEAVVPASLNPQQGLPYVDRSPAPPPLQQTLVIHNHVWVAGREITHQVRRVIRGDAYDAQLAGAH